MPLLAVILCCHVCTRMRSPNRLRPRGCFSLLRLKKGKTRFWLVSEVLGCLTRNVAFSPRLCLLALLPVVAGAGSCPAQFVSVVCPIGSATERPGGPCWARAQQLKGLEGHAEQWRTNRMPRGPHARLGGPLCVTLGKGTAPEGLEGHAVRRAQLRKAWRAARKAWRASLCILDKVSRILARRSGLSRVQGGSAVS
jgi:hypothetical protein